MNNYQRSSGLYEIAAQQAGYFTASQAQQAGFSRPLLVHHTRTGLFQRAQHGIYRLTQFPQSAYEDMFIALLRVGPQAVISHDSALAVYGLSDALPTRIHIIAPASTSRRRAGIQLHNLALRPDEISRWDGLRVTTAARAIADATASGMQLWLVEQAVRQALQRGLLLTDQLAAQAEHHSLRVRKILMSMLAKVAAERMDHEI